MKMFTFKRDARETGLRAISQVRGTDIKLGGKIVGRLQPPGHYDVSRDWVIRFRVTSEPTTEEPRRTWKWIVLKQRFEDEDCARAYVHAHYGTLQQKLDLSPEED